MSIDKLVEAVKEFEKNIPKDFETQVSGKSSNSLVKLESIFAKRINYLTSHIEKTI